MHARTRLLVGSACAHTCLELVKPGIKISKPGTKISAGICLDLQAMKLSQETAQAEAIARPRRNNHRGGGDERGEHSSIQMIDCDALNAVDAVALSDSPLVLECSESTPEAAAGRAAAFTSPEREEGGDGGARVSRDSTPLSNSDAGEAHAQLESKFFDQTAKVNHH